MAHATYQVSIKRRADNGEQDLVDAGQIRVAGLYDSLDDVAGLLALRANRAQYGYEVNPAEGMVYVGAAAVRLEQFEGLEVRLVSKSVE